jgi:hypothetical protein
MTADSHSVLSLMIIKYGSSLLWKKIDLLPLSHMLLDLSFITVLQYLNLRSAIFRSLLRPLRAVVMMPVLSDGSKLYSLQTVRMVQRVRLFIDILRVFSVSKRSDA